MVKLFEHLVLCEACSGGGFTGNSGNDEEDVCQYCTGLGMVTPDEAPKKCNYCDEIVEELSFTPILADGSAKMCKHCWEITRDDYMGVYGEDIGEFRAKEANHG